MIAQRGADDRKVPPVLAVMAAWSWRLIVIGVVIYFTVQAVVRLSIVALPIAVALLLTALLFPLTDRLRKAGLRPIWATWITLLLSFVLVIGLGFIIGTRANEEFPRLFEQVQKTTRDVQDWLLHGPLQLREAQLTQMVDEVVRQINTQRSAITSTLLSTAAVFVEVLASIVLLLFVTFFLLKDGERIWSWVLRGFGSASPRVDRAGRAAWHTLSQYIHGTVIVAAIHGVVIGIVLFAMGVPLWAPLAVLIFLASFIPIVGIFFAGGLAALVTLGAKGLVYALVFLGILLIEQQLENHVLQPLIVGRAVKFHPLAIILVLAVGGILGGIAGAAIAVPIAAVLYRALPELRRSPPELPPALPHGPEPPPPPEPGADPPAPRTAPERTPAPEPGAPEPGAPEGERLPGAGEDVSPQRSG
ncbi:AI-2E family transporter [Sphaerisporangium sp. TRM90804]|uniref:AI-2E family transporter n=1 Tax=Sphaerisporangium sp. TRM90804 TaxID=3031113 RepID=UPI002448C072|nr:AI-2E family transporter [Sphaerisporangium sp. TRM90804]MDH2424290.1 AI-2E family transporter [Sphaerisporangium sp. TRM90804]